MDSESKRHTPPSNDDAPPAAPQQFTAVNNTKTTSESTTNGNAAPLPPPPPPPPPPPSAAAAPSPLPVTSVFGGSHTSPRNSAAAPHPPSSQARQQPPVIFTGSRIYDSANHSPTSPPNANVALLAPTEEWQPDTHKRKRSISPTTQTQHHHLAAHEAALGATTPGHTPHDHTSEENGDRSVRDGTVEDSSPHPQGLQVDPNTGVRVDPKRRKRVFSNRTKTGCITCRRRKKKCDEGKPECTNCKRGGFLCEGYSGKVSWQKPPGKQTPSQSLPGQPYIQSKEEQPGGSPTPGVLHTPTTRIGMDERFPVRSDEQPAPLAPPSTGSMSPRPYLSLRSDATPSAAATTPGGQQQPDSGASVSAASASAPGGSDRRVSFPALPAAPGYRPRSEKEKMINSELYHASAPELVAEREACKAACWRYNNAANPNIGISEVEKGRLLLDVLRPGNKWEVVNTGAAPADGGRVTYVSENGYTSDIVDVTVDSPFTCSYGYNVRLGKNVYIEFGCTILDSCLVTIKARTILSPGVSIYSATHPIDPRKRNGARGPEMAKPVTIEEDCWLGGNVIVLGGITIGKGSVVGAGSVVTRDVPPFTVVAGNPARVIRGIYQNGVDM